MVFVSLINTNRYGSKRSITLYLNSGDYDSDQV